jgi:type IV pilus assembly protein PilC
MPKKLQRKVVVAQTPAASGATVASEPASSQRAPLFGGRRVTPRLLAEFTSQLAVLLDAGIPITKCLRILDGQLRQGALKRTVGQVLEDVESGTSLSEALAKHPRTFDRLYTNMVLAGEKGGVQEEILNRLATFMEKSEALKGRVKGALAYPIAVLAVALLVLTLVFIFVIPKFKEIFRQQFGRDDKLPALTQLVINVGDHVAVWWPAYLVGIVAVVLLHRLLVRSVHGYRSFIDKRKLRTPVLGNLVSKSLVARFTRTFGTLIQSGVPHLEALEIVEGALPNVHMTTAVRSIHSSIREGAGIAVPMGNSGIFDDIVVNMVDVGEQTGELDRMLAKVSDRYEGEIDRAVTMMFKIVEPLMLIILAVVVGVIVLALLQPLIELMKSIH